MSAGTVVEISSLYLPLQSFLARGFNRLIEIINVILQQPFNEKRSKKELHLLREFE